MKKIIYLFFVLFLLSCNSILEPEQNFIQAFENKYNVKLQKNDWILIYREPACHSCNIKYYQYLQNTEISKNQYLIYFCSYPDTSKLNFFKEKFKNQFYLERTDSLLQQIPQIYSSGKIVVINNKEIKVSNFKPENESIELFMKR